ncbi:hypothetical protein [Aurantiacibacter gangjinensis]|uniref:Uncharacterized protein n=1 Tax=Aurantiacibacter gangjinensis TaxID=502682 RepID=A0A0G9MKP1_9SPHN|nr:hypothetical protein [Aurantiacibacter gangjinensis]APE29444.1 hypothetical protein BMF35_b0189 [Aurantiacibacter gangjinensis]KLE31174.1 hypothetical protein AAW01_13200 [Aurantiacibacter gangjinensis]
MSDIQKALLWASAMVVLALAVAAGLVSESTATPIFYTIPALSVATSSRMRCCGIFARRKE